MKKPALYASLAAGVLMLSSSGLFARLSSAPAAITAFYRLFFAALTLTAVALCRAPLRRELFSASKRQLLLGAAGGFFLAVHYTLWFQSLRYTSVASSTVLAALQPLFSALLGFFFLRERLGARALLGGAAALAGTAFIAWGDFGVSAVSLKGNAMALLSGAVISVYFFFSQLLRRDSGAVLCSVLSYGSAAAFLALFALTAGQSFTGYPSADWACFAGLAFLSTLGGQMVFTILLKWLTATQVTMGILGEPAGTCFLAWAFLGEGLTLRQAAGIAVIMAGLGVFFTAQKRSA